MPGPITVKPLNNGHFWDKPLFRGCPFLEVCIEMYGQYIGRGEQFVHCREVVHSLKCPLFGGSTVYNNTVEMKSTKVQNPRRWLRAGALDVRSMHCRMICRQVTGTEPLTARLGPPPPPD